LRLSEEALDLLVDWQGAHLVRGRPVQRGNLHVTLAFLGHRPRAELPAICAALGDSSAASGPIVLRAERYRETRSVGMIVFDDLTGAATALAADLHGRLERLGVYERERRQWLPHVTVARFREPLRLRPPLPDVGEIVPSDAALYHSVLRSDGAQYEVLESFQLGGR
jgi:2'-5' RNA ligase